MNDILEKLNRVRDEILAEKTKGSLRLFVLAARADLENKWDILFSADWLEKTNSEKDLIYIIGKLKSSFSGNLDFLVRIVVATPSETFIKQLADAILKRNEGRQEEIKELSTPTVVFKQIFVLTLDFRGINLNEIGTEDGPIAVKKISEF